MRDGAIRLNFRGALVKPWLGERLSLHGGGFFGVAIFLGHK